MKLAPSGVGAEPKKLALLASIVVIGGIVYWIQNRSDTPTVSASVTPQTVVAPPAPAPAAKPAQPDLTPPVLPASPSTPPEQQHREGAFNGVGGAGMEDFRPTLKVKEDVNLSQVDPRIRLDLLAKLRETPLEGGSSSLFEFSKPPEPPTPAVAPITPAAVPVPTPVPGKTNAVTKQAGPPPSPPIPFKYYGYAGKSADGQLEEGFFIEGDPNTGEVYRKKEGDIVKDRYKIVRISVRSATVEDTVSHEEKTLQLLEEPQ